jgi:hypothetical protein
MQISPKGLDALPLAEAGCGNAARHTLRHQPLAGFQESLYLIIPSAACPPGIRHLNLRFNP